MIDISEALAITDSHFPHGPEMLAEHLGAKIRRGGLERLDGYCISYRDKLLIRISEEFPPTRQRFTLAHELAHLLLETQHSATRDLVATLSSGGREETDANRLAAKMLLPDTHIRRLLHGAPVDAAALERIARRAKVSPIMVAYHLSNFAKELGLTNACVVFFQKQQKPRAWSRTLKIEGDAALGLLSKVDKHDPRLLRAAQGAGKVFTAALLRNPGFTALFVQLLPTDIAHGETWDEQRERLDRWLFANATSFRNSFSGAVSYIKQNAAGLSLPDAVAKFDERYQDRWAGEEGRRFRSPQGQTYLKMRLADWFEDE